MEILIVDDSKFTRQAIGRELQQGGYTTREAADGREALDILVTCAPDLVTLDVEMPGLDGFETCLRIRGGGAGDGSVVLKNPSVPVIFVTADDTLAGRARGFEVGATDFITKNFETGELSRLVDRLLSPSNSLAGTTALVVDDSKVSRQIASSILRKQGVCVLEAENGREGLEILRDKSDKIDLVLTDQSMPELDGIGLCSHARQQLGLTEIPIIFLAGGSFEYTALDIFNAGATDYLRKPYLNEELVARAGTHLEACRLEKILRNNLEDQTRLNQKLEEQAARLDAANRTLASRNKDLDEFVYVASHDLQEPLRKLASFSFLLKEDLGDALPPPCGGGYSLHTGLRPEDADPRPEPPRPLPGRLE